MTLRIGLMLRAYDEKGGVGVYTRNLVEELLHLETAHQFVLYYQNPAHRGRFAHYANVTERVVRGRHKLYWDQIAIPWACWRDRLDVILHPKFTTPLLAPCHTVMVVHGADWFMPDQAIYYHWLDVAYIRAVMPYYFRKCAKVISVSQLTTDNFYQVLKLPPGKIETIYFGPARHFQPITDPAELARVRTKYSLPNSFILTLTKRLGDGRKNLGQLLAAYGLYHQQAAQPAPLVVGGKDCHLFYQEYRLDETNYGDDVRFPGWIDQADMPAVYSLATVYLYPSNLEAFPIPLTEAMACGTPIITSNVNGLVEIAGDAALLVDPQNPADIAAALQTVLADPIQQAALSTRGVARAPMFSWPTCAQKIMDCLEGVAAAKS